MLTLLLSKLPALGVIAMCLCDLHAQQLPSALFPAPTFYADEPACKVKAVQHLPTHYESVAVSPNGVVAATNLDVNGVYQVYVANIGDNQFRCISCTAQSGSPSSGRNKPMISWHPSGNWLMVGVEEDTHEDMWFPAAWQRGLLQSGIWLNIWATTPTGDQWWQLTEFKKSQASPSDGSVGVAFTSDGKRGVWAEIVDGNIFVYPNGLWKLYMADFSVSSNGSPSFLNKREITPTGAEWIEPGNITADGHLLLTTDNGISDSEGQDQWALDLNTGARQNLTATSKVWDEHGYYSSDGSKISFMSSYPYRNILNSYKSTSLETEFMLMDADGSHLQQVTHFNVPGFAESQSSHTVAAVAQFIGDGSKLLGTVMATDYSFTKTNWLITFEGRCGANHGRSTSLEAR